jgi:hypothetical protein
MLITVSPEFAVNPSLQAKVVRIQRIHRHRACKVGEGRQSDGRKAGSNAIPQMLIRL